MKEYKVKKEDLIGEIKDFPIEVVQKMVDYQVEQGNKADVSLFQNVRCKIVEHGGFDWCETKDGVSFWDSILNSRNFDLFFDKYPKNETSETEEPKDEIDTHVYYRGNAERGDEIISELIKLGGVNYYNISARHIGCYYLVDPKNKRINFMSSSEDSLYSHILEESYTEKFLPENKQEIIEIDGKKYNKQEVLDRMKELKEVK